MNSCLVLEGSAFRGVYTQGVLDYFLENDLYFSCVIGVSAGALSGMNYISRQIGRSAYINFTYRHDKRYIDAKKLLTQKIVNLDFLINDVNEEFPFDEKTFNEAKERFIAVATDLDTGKAIYFEKGKCSDIYSAVKASASMPFISKIVEVDGHKCLDGGCADKVPFRFALDEGYKKIVVIRTRDISYRKDDDIPKAIIDRLYKDHPAFCKTLAKTNALYNAQCDELEILAKYGAIFTIAPSTTVDVSRLEGDVDKLKALYEQGYNDAKERFDELLAYLRS